MRVSSTGAVRLVIQFLAVGALLAVLVQPASGEPESRANPSAEAEDLPSSIPDPDYSPPEPTGIVITSPELDSQVWVAPYEAFVVVRSQYGLDVSRSTYEKLTSSDPGAWMAGVPLSGDERAQVDRWEAQHIASNDVLAELHTLPGFAGSALGPDGTPETLRVFGNPRFVRALDARSSDLSRGGLLGTTVQEVTYSLEQLEAQQKAILALALGDSSGLSIAAAAINVESNAVDVDLVASEGATPPVDLDQVRERITASAPGAGEIHILDANASKFSLCNQNNCRPVSAGVGIGTGGTNHCTQGFVLVRLDTGNMYASTAGHCAGLGAATTMGPLALGTVAYRDNHDGGNADALAVDIPDTIATNDRLDVYDTGGAGFPITGIEHQWELSQNEWYCVRGISSSGCGQVTSVSTSACFAYSPWPFCSFEQHDLVKGTWTGAGGDSGGGTYMKYSPKDALGLLTGSGYYTHIDNVNSLHSQMRLWTADLPTRDWVIPLYIQGLQRNPDSGGLNYWHGYLAGSCGLGRARDVYYALLLSGESLNIGSWWTDAGIYNKVDRAWFSGLGRVPSTTERNAWLNHIKTGATTSARQGKFADLVYTITFSSEFAGRVNYGSQGDRPACSQ